MSAMVGMAGRGALDHFKAMCQCKQDNDEPLRDLTVGARARI
jgi:hypothetical protein